MYLHSFGGKKSQEKAAATTNHNKEMMATTGHPLVPSILSPTRPTNLLRVAPPPPHTPNFFSATGGGLGSTPSDPGGGVGSPGPQIGINLLPPPPPVGMRRRSRRGAMDLQTRWTADPRAGRLNIAASGVKCSFAYAIRCPRGEGGTPVARGGQERLTEDSKADPKADSYLGYTCSRARKFASSQIREIEL